MLEQKDEEIPAGQVKTRDKRCVPEPPGGSLRLTVAAMDRFAYLRESPLLKAFGDKSPLLRTREIIEISKLEFGLLL